MRKKPERGLSNVSNPFRGVSSPDSESKITPLKGALAAAFLLLLRPAKASEYAEKSITPSNVEPFLNSLEFSSENPEFIVQRAKDIFSFVNKTKESDPAMKKLIKQFYMAGGDSATIAAKRNSSTVPWSAAFISYVINPHSLVLPMGKMKGSLSHASYVMQQQKYLASVQKGTPEAYVYYFPTLDDLQTEGPKLGDIVVTNRENAKNAFPNVQQAYSHGAIITDIFFNDDGMFVKLIGGNESNTVLETTRSWESILNDLRETNKAGTGAVQNKNKTFTLMRHPYYSTYY